MCLARVEFIGDKENGARQPLIDVARIDLAASHVRAIDLTGTVSEFVGDVQSIDFIDSVVRIKAAGAPWTVSRCTVFPSIIEGRASYAT